MESIMYCPAYGRMAEAVIPLFIRKDIFDAAGVDVTELEKTWTYDDFYEACKKVKEYTGCEYVISDYVKG